MAYEDKYKLFAEHIFQDRDIHDSTIRFIQSEMQSIDTLEGYPKLKESFFSDKMRQILSNKIGKLDNSYQVIDDQVYSKLNETLSEKSENSLVMQLDFQILTNDNDLLAAYELKSIFGSNKTTKELFLKDIARLAIVKKLFPKSKCIFVFSGKTKQLLEFFDDSEFPFDDNVNHRTKVPYVWQDIDVDIFSFLNTEYLGVLKDLKIDTVQVKLSRTQYHHDYHTMSYRVRVAPVGYFPTIELEKCNWEDVEEGDFIFYGNTLSPNFLDCKKVDGLSLESNQVMFQTQERHLSWRQLQATLSQLSRKMS